MDTILSTIEDGAGRMVEQTVDHGDGTATVYGEGGLQGGVVIDTIKVPLPEPVPATSGVAEAVAAARQAVSGLSATAATRKAVEALADAVESLP